MPITENGIGFGKYTGKKIEHFSKILGMHMAITREVIKKNQFRFERIYHYFDLTAGQGKTPDGNQGSPLVFLDKVCELEFDIPFTANLIEHDPTNYTELVSSVSAHPLYGDNRQNINFYAGDYEIAVRSLFRTTRVNQLGLFFVDHTGTLPSFDTLSFVGQVRPRMEILIYLPATNVKRLYGKTSKLLSDYLDDIGKSHWLIREPFKGDSHQWTFLLGSNWDKFPRYKSIKFYRLDSDEGKRIFRQMNLSKEQRFEEDQPRLL
jgi:three-Cys-motif partner protein